jgi:WD40 repeat protein
VNVWDAATGRLRLSFAPRTAWGRIALGNCPAVFTPDGKGILMPGFIKAQTGLRGVVGGWEATTGKPLFAFPVGSARTKRMPSFFCLSPDGKFFASEAEGKAGTKGYGFKVWSTATGRELRAWGHPNRAPSGLAFSPDSRRIVLGFESGGSIAIKVWRVADGRELLSLGPVFGPTSHLAFSPDGKRLAVATGRGNSPSRLAVFDAATGQKLYQRELPAFYNRVVFSPDGTRLACAALGPTVLILEAATGRVRRTLKGYTVKASTGLPMSLAFTPDGTRLLSLGTDRTVRTWDATLDDEPLVFQTRLSQVDQVAWSGDGRRFAVTGWSSAQPQVAALQVWARSGQKLFVVSLGPRTGYSPLTHLDVSRNGRRVAVATSYPPVGKGSGTGRPGGLRVWDITTGKQLFRRTRKAGFAEVALSPDGRRVAAVTGLPGSQVRVWDIATGKCQDAFPGFGDSFRSLAFSPDGRLLVRAGTGKERPAYLKVWDLAAGRERLSLREPTDGRQVGNVCLAFSPDGRHIAWSYGMGGAPTEIKVHHVASGRVLRVLKGHPDAVTSVSFSPDGRRLVSSGLARGLAFGGGFESRVWDLATGGELLSLTSGSAIFFGPGGRRLFSPVRETKGFAVRMWDATPRPGNGGRKGRNAREYCPGLPK